MKIVVAMSGGVDSSVVAHLLKEEGHEVVGIMMKLWSDPLAPITRDVLPKKCCSIEHIQRARNVCNGLNIPFYVVNLEDEFKTKVVDFYLAEHTKANTPNPCVECNRTIKFGALMEKVAELGFDALATGHYANLHKEADLVTLSQATDNKKDQSYYLYTLPQSTLQKVMFPLGDMQKTAVYVLAKKFKIEIPKEYAESEDLCFYPENSPNPFLSRYLPTITEGPIINEQNQQVGTHKGLPYYTYGQRRGLGIGGLKVPLHVVRKEPATNTLYVAENGKDMSPTFTISQLHWQQQPTKHMLVRVSSLGTFYHCTVELQDSFAKCTLEKPVRGLAPGQSAVFYNSGVVVGGGIITTDTGN